MSATDVLRQGLAVPRTSVLDYVGDNMSWLIAAHPQGKAGAERLLQSAAGPIGSDPQVLAADPASVLQALVDVARFGLELGDVRSQAWLSVRDGQARMQLGYRGVIDLAGRAGIICEVHDVHEHDEFAFAWGLEQQLTHRPQLRGDRGTTYAWWAIARIRGHAPVAHVMSRGEIEQFRDSLRLGDNPDGAWARHFDSMARKTVLLRLTNYLPYSDPVFADAINRDAVNAGTIPSEAPHARIPEHHRRDPLAAERDRPADRADRREDDGAAPAGPAPEGPRGDSPSPRAPDVDPVAEADRALVLARYTRDAKFLLADAHSIETMSAWNAKTLNAKLLAFLPDDPADWRVPPSEPF